MTRYETLLRDALVEEVGTLDTRAAEQLILRGLLNRPACERLVVRREVARLAREGVPRCEALVVAADLLCCSYEKVRSYYYNTYKS